MQRKALRNSYRNLSILLAFLSFLAIVDLLPANQTAYAQSKPLRIAVNLPLSGPIAAFCGQYPNGLTMGIDDGCKALGIDRSKFVMDVQDNAGQPSQSVTVCRKQMMQSPDLYFSGTSQMSLPIAPEISKEHVPHFLVAFDALLCHNGPGRIRILPNFKIESPAYLEYVKARKAKRIFIFSCNISSYNEQFEKLILPQLKKSQVEYAREIFDFDCKDYRSLVLKASQYKPDLIVIAGFSTHIYPLVSLLRSYGLIKHDNVISTLDFIDLLHGGTAKSELTDVAFTSPPYEITGALKEPASWASRYKQRFKHDPSYVEAYAYDTGRMITQAYKRYGKVDEQLIRATLPYKGVCGEINIDKDGDLNTKLCVAHVEPNGSVKKILQ